MSKPLGSTIRRKKGAVPSRAANFSGGKLNMMASNSDGVNNTNIQPKQDCLDGAGVCNPKGGYGGGDLISEEIPGPKYEPKPIPKTPIDAVDIPDEKPVTPTPAPPAGSTKEEEPVYPPPYSYEWTQVAPCEQLGEMIASVKNSLLTSKFSSAQRNVYTTWLAYAEDKYNAGCKVIVPDTPVQAEPQPQPTQPTQPAQPSPVIDNPIIDTPTTQVPDVPYQEPTLDDPIVPVPDKVETVVIDNGNPTVDAPDEVKTVTVPTTTPYPTGPAGGGGGGGGAAEEPGKPEKYFYWFWPVVAAVGAAGYIILQFTKKKAS